MTIHLITRFAQCVLLLLGVSFGTFWLLAIAPGDYFQELSLNPQISAQTITRLRTQYGTDRPLLVRYKSWLRSISHGDLGYSLEYGGPVLPLLLVRMRNTLLLTGPAILFAWLLAILLGVPCATRPGGSLDRVCLLLSSALLVIPELLLGIFLLFVATRTGWLRTGGMVSPGFERLSVWRKAQDVLAHSAVPVLVLLLNTFPIVFQHIRSAIAETLDAPFIKAAHGHGISPLRILMRHAIPASVAPIVSLAGLSLSSLLTVALMTEVVTSWPGLGPLLLDAVLARDLYVVIGATMMTAPLLIFGTVLTDTLLCMLDPRISCKGLQ